MNEIVFTLEFDDDFANSRANDFLAKGWKLLHVGTKVVGLSEGQFYYNTSYVMGANLEQYKAYQEEEKRDLLDDF